MRRLYFDSRRTRFDKPGAEPNGIRALPRRETDERNSTILQKLFFKYVFKNAEDEDKGASARREKKLAKGRGNAAMTVVRGSKKISVDIY